MKIAIASDHGGFDLKEDLRSWLTEQGHQIEDFGCPGHDSCDYADFVEPAARAVAPLSIPPLRTILHWTPMACMP